MGLFKRNNKANKTEDAASAAVDPAAIERDYSHIDSQEKAQAAAQRGELVSIMLMPEMFGGHNGPPNVVYVAPGIDEVKRLLDGTMMRFAQEGLINTFNCEIKYDDGPSVVPRKLHIKCANSDPAKTGTFNPTIDVW